MPFYEYRCEACGHQLEAMQKMSDELLSECPECNKPTLVKLMSVAGVQVKGGKAQNKAAPQGCPASGCSACSFEGH